MKLGNSSGVRSALSLALLALAAVTLLSVVQMMSSDRAAANRDARLDSQLDEVLAGIERNNEPASDIIMVSHRQLGTDTALPLYRARMDGRATGLVMTCVAPDGYSGEIRLLVGVDTEGTILGARVLEHRETPGIGDRIERRRSDWITLVNGHSLNKPASGRWHIRPPDGAFDAITGATITSRAIVSAIHDALLWYEDNKLSAFSTSDPTTGGNLSPSADPASARMNKAIQDTGTINQ